VTYGHNNKRCMEPKCGHRNKRDVGQEGCREGDARSQNMNVVTREMYGGIRTQSERRVVVSYPCLALNSNQC
jgi:hypothetical protein